jgi:hypothetical protein
MNAHWLFVVFFCCACSIRQRIAPSQLVTSQLAPMDYQVLDWVDSTVCSTYAFSLRMREKKAEDKVTGKRAGILSRGAVLGGRPPDVDSADALYDAMVQLPSASFLLVPRYKIQSKGLLFGTRPIFGRRCSRVETRGVAVGSSPAQTK